MHSRRDSSRIGRWEHLLARSVLALGRSPRGRAGRGRPRGILHIFRRVEGVMEWGHTIRRLRPDGVVRYEVAPLPRGTITLPGGPTIRRGERVVILHLDNHAVAARAAAASSMRDLTWQLVIEAKRDLEALADLVRTGAIPPDVRAVWAETLIYPALARFGFTTRPAPRTLRTPFARLYFLTLIAIYGREHLTHQADAQLYHLRLGLGWIALDELQRRYAAHAE